MIIRINNHQTATPLRNTTELNSYHQDWSILFNNQSLGYTKPALEMWTHKVAHIYGEWKL